MNVPSPRARARVSRIACGAAGAWALLVGLSGELMPAARADDERLRESIGSGQVDWGEGKVSAGAGSAPDHRLPSPDVARAGATKRARARAEEQLRDVLGRLPAAQKLGDEARTRALAAAEEKVELQSDGGAWVRLEVSFGPWLDAAHKTSPAGDKAAANPWRDPLVFAVPAMRPVAAPIAEDKGKKVVLWRARYREGTPPAQARALELEATASGSLRPAGKGHAWPDDLSQRDVLIYVKKLTR